MNNIITMEEVEVFRFHPLNKTVKKIMTLHEFNAMEKQEGYLYRTYQIGYNSTIV